MATVLYRLGRGSFRHRGWVVGAWLLVVAVVTAGAVAFSGALASAISIPGTQAQQALGTLAREFPEAAGGSGNLVVRAPAGRVLTDPAGQRVIADVEAQAGRLGSVAAVNGPSRTGLISRDGRVAVIQVQFSRPVDALPTSTKNAFDAVSAPAAYPGYVVAHGGEIAVVPPAVDSTEVVGVVIAAIVLVITFGSLVAAGMTMLTALIGVGAGMGGLYALSGAVQLNATTPVLALMLGLAVGIDYSLFITARYRHNLLQGHAPAEAAGRATGTAGSAVVFAGATVIIALSGLSVVGIDFLTKMGLAAAATVAIAVLVSLTLSPALLAFAGSRALPRKLRDGQGAADALARQESRRTWGYRWAHWVTRHRLIATLVVTFGLAVATVPALSMQTSLPDPGHAPSGTTARTAADLVTEGFGIGVNGPLLIVVDGTADADAATIEPRAQQLTASLGALPGVAAVSPPMLNQNGRVAVLQVIPTTGPTDQKTSDLVGEIRDLSASIPHARVLVTGFTAVGIDVSQNLSDALPIYLCVVVGLSLLLLTLVFRSLLVPLKATLGFLLTIGATFGITVAVFQWGWLSDAVGVAKPGPLVSFMPIIVTGILFGLAMDYEVFLVSRMREERTHGATPGDAIVVGVHHGARVVTAAAVIMCSVFAAFAFGEDPTIKSMAFALATGITIDAFLVRMTLVPAVMSLLSRHAWWLPRTIDRLLPDLDIEGKALTDTAPPMPTPAAPAQLPLV